MKPIVIRFPPSARLGEPKEAEVIIFPRIRQRIAELVASWNARGYTVSSNRHGRLVVRPKASRAKLFFDRIRRHGR